MYMEHPLPFKKSLEQVVLRRIRSPHPAILFIIYAEYGSLPSPYFRINNHKIVEDKNEIRSTVLALGIAATLTGCQNMDSNALLSSGAEAFGHTLSATRR